MGLYIQSMLIPYMVATAQDDTNEDGSFWTLVNGSQKRFEISFEGFDGDILCINFAESVEFIVDINDGHILRVSFLNPLTSDFDANDILKNLCHPDVQVVS